jgi:4-amino-4-deoxy-L-arabinose transferase-like glycosyltransferase
VYPNLWMSAGLGMSETISPGLMLLVIWAGYRMWRRPVWSRAVVLGLAIGLAALARDELILMVGLVLLPIAVGGRGRPWRERFRLMGAGVAATVLVVGPWVGYNLERFSHPVFITDRFGLALATANCDTAWHRPFPGFWSATSATESVAHVTGDESAQQGPPLRFALRYIGDHIGGLPAQEMFRLGRTFGVYQPSQQVELDSSVEARPHAWVIVGFGMYYAMVLLVPWGAWSLKRRGIPLFPLAAAAIDVVIVALVTYGDTRFRATLDPVIVILASVTIVDAFRRRPFARRRPPEPGEFPARSDPTPADLPESGRRAEVGA